MTVDVSVSQIRNAIYVNGDASANGQGQRSHALLGTMFHRLFEQLVSQDSTRNLEAALEDAGDVPANWGPLVADFAYRTLLGPTLSEQRAPLEDLGTEVLLLWVAVQELSNWLAELCAVLAESSRLRPQLAARKLVQEFVSTEERLTCEIQRPDWSETVRLSGQADAVVRIPNRPVACVVELKLGRTAPEADLAQACLYHAILQQCVDQHCIAASLAGHEEAENRALAIVSFQPERHEHLLQATEIAAAQRTLEDLAGRIAGVNSISTTTQNGSKPDIPKKTPAVERETLSMKMPTAAHREQARRIVDLYGEFQLHVELDGQPIVGPTFIRYRLRPGRRVTVRQLEQRSQELQLRLGLDCPPIIQTDHDVVTIDVRRPDREYVLYSSVRDQIPEGDAETGSAMVPVGIDLSGRLKFANLAEPQNCHMLVSGTTGSGKSEWLRSALAGLVDRNTPQTLKLVLIDPKRNAFLDLKDSPFLLQPIVFPDSEDVVAVLDGLVAEMERRYRLMDGADSINDYIRSSGQPLPRIVCVCDEYADLISQDAKQRKEIEARISRLGFKARAAGIHLILTTQVPRRDVVSGPIKANMPCRVALKTAEDIESRTILGENGAENLLGNGDLLFKDIGVQRLQSPYLPENERRLIFRTPVSQPQPDAR